MNDFINVLNSYIKRNILMVTVVLISFGIFLLVFSLYILPLEAVVYSILLTSVFILLVGIVDFINFYKKHLILDKLKNSITISDFVFANSKDLIEKDYQELISIIDKKRAEIISDKDNAYNDMLDYYTIWAHQIKTPIAAMRLLLQSEQSNTNIELLEQLFKVEQYVEMVLQYLRMENMHSDLLIKRYLLDDIIKQSVRKYLKLFIRKKIKLSYEELNYKVLTDEKWFGFVIEQILSNSLKYTNEGEILIYMDKNMPETLVIEDTGIGIEKEDLPRISERGFTGYNGRLYKKSTGIGLYLCKRILNNLSHTITIESQVGKGTKVKIGLDVTDIRVE
ncbi:signal transduction histidine kinase [Sedimentibacter acidaminivorans]|uniref:histidine kinase n=1 Tax=Sedimentibacter acidaminivorans TaxID=913099 RepID=A0ABS4GI52_9FIRM|nr:sensor histidine kinase [Sedimentibacter acidaminivorans]MBP1927222.1 signal transduction histidine kinase [Sedimentibacter acidaminivorans]